MSFIVPTPKNKYLSSSKYRTDIRLLLSEFWKQLRDAVFERVDRFLNPPPPYVSQYSLRTEIEHSRIREMLKGATKHCEHLKGNRYGVKSSLRIKDYNVSYFKFIDGKIRVRCNTCGQKWYPGDEHWDAAAFMVRNSSNTPAQSEIPSEVLNGKSLRDLVK